MASKKNPRAFLQLRFLCSETVCDYACSGSAGTPARREDFSSLSGGNSKLQIGTANQGCDSEGGASVALSVNAHRNGRRDVRVPCSDIAAKTVELLYSIQRRTVCLRKKHACCGANFVLEKATSRATVYRRHTGAIVNIPIRFTQSVRAPVR